MRISIKIPWFHGNIFHPEKVQNAKRKINLIDMRVAKDKHNDLIQCWSKVSHINLTIAERGFFLPRNTLMIHPFFYRLNPFL